MAFTNVFFGAEVAFGFDPTGRVDTEAPFDDANFYRSAAKRTPLPAWSGQLREFEPPDWEPRTEEFNYRGSVDEIVFGFNRTTARVQSLGVAFEFDAHYYEEGFWMRINAVTSTGGIQTQGGNIGEPATPVARGIVHTLRGRIIAPNTGTITQNEYSAMELMIHVRQHKYGISLLDQESYTDASQSLYLVGRNMDSVRGDYRRGGVALLNQLNQTGAGSFGRRPDSDASITDLNAANGLIYYDVHQDNANPITANYSMPQDIIPRFPRVPSGDV